MKNLLVTAILLMVFSSCNKEKEEVPVIPDDSEIIQGLVVMPEGSSTDVSSLNVVANTTSSAVVDSGYDVGNIGNYTSTYVTNSSGDVLLMGYTYPGKPNNDINSESTALGMVMMSPTVISLSNDAKLEIIQNVLNDMNYETLINEIDKTLINGSALFDTTNTQLMSVLSSLFDSVSGRGGGGDDLPVNMSRGGRNFIISNSATAYSTVIGIYKDGEFEDKIIVDGVQIVPNYIPGLFQGEGGSIGEPIEHNYDIVGDGSFTFKFRTGFPGQSDGSSEHDEAFYENLGQFSYNLLLTLVPQLEDFSSCYLTIKNNVVNSAMSILDISSDSNAGVGTILYTIAELTIGSVSSLLECADIEPEQEWFSSFLKQWNFINKAFDTISNGANTAIFATQWSLAEAVTDTCFIAEGNSVTPGCTGCDGATTLTDSRDGQIYQIVQIGEQCWMAENLRYDPPDISQVSGEVGWADIYNNGFPTGQPAWCYYDVNAANDVTYGKLYNWYAINTGTLCPDGWHIPTDAEWQVLEMELGMSLDEANKSGSRGEVKNVGGKMKSTLDWNTPNTGATNESGFSALPGGYRGYYGYFYDVGDNGTWWSSSEYNTNSAWYRSLGSGYSGVSRGNEGVASGFSCRCVRD